MLVWNWRGIACERGTTTLRFWPYKQKKQSDECVDTLKCAKLTSASPWQQFIRHVIAFMFYYMHIEKHHQHPFWRHLRSSASTIHGTTWNATHRNSQCNNSKQSCRNRFFVWRLSVSVANVERTRRRTNKHSKYSRSYSYCDMALHTCLSKLI
jgi:hypothetical protein